VNGGKIIQINQILPSISYGDAISNHVLEIRDILRSCGYRSEIYAQYIHPKLKNDVKVYTEYKNSYCENILLFHYSIGSEITDFVRLLPDKKILIYHNITPHSYLYGVNDTLVNLLKKGRNELGTFSNEIVLALGDSEFNRGELNDRGFMNTGVLPIIIDFDKYAQKPTQKIMDIFNDGHPNFLFVGRISPNKKQEDIIKTFYYYKKHIDSKARLFLVGSYKGMGEYYGQLVNLIKELGLNDVFITGHVDFTDILAYYKVADVFISMSEHEGFCVPLLESMYFKIPIFAYNSTAIPYTLDGSGVLFNEKRYEEVAEMCHLLISDKFVRGRIINKQNKRLEMFEKSIIEKTLVEYIEQVKS
jgi:glycosyltransferase involved in cell wall biosynthesis